MAHGKEPKFVVKVFESPYNGRIEKEVELLLGRKLDAVDLVKQAFNL